MSKRKVRGRKQAVRPPTPNVPLTPQKRIFFAVALALTPVLVLVLLELLLRLFSYGGDLNLVVREKEGDHDVYRINRAVARLYFSQPGIVIPSPHEDEFEIVKPPRTIRIFCLGESTMQGFPYEQNATPPSFLRDRLQAELPGYNVEVINVGLSAVGSYVVKDFINELSAYQADLYVVYVGHNEFYGAYGPGSSVAVHGPQWLTRLSLTLLHFKTFLLLRDGYSWLTAHFGSGGGAAPGTLMTEMVSNADIPYGGAIYRTGLSAYSANLASIIESAKDQHIPILMSTLVSNIGDQPPFQSLYAQSTTAEERQRCERWISTGDSLARAGAPDAALPYMRRAVATDSTNAMACFKLGKLLEALGAYDEARHELVRAKDMDAVRFRATEEFQSTLLQICSRTQTPVSRVDSAFEAASPHGIIGNGLILEHLHPNFQGYFLMAKTWANDIRSKGLLNVDLPWTAAPDDSTLMARADLSPFDLALARFRIEALTHHWPYPSHPGRTAPPTDPVEKLAFESANNTLPWAQAKYAAAEYYSGIRQFAAARREMLGVAHAQRTPYLPLARVGDYYLMERKLPEAESLYRASIAAHDNSYARMNLGVLYGAEQKTANAAHELEEAFALNAKEPTAFAVPIAAYGRMCLAKAYAGEGKVSEARREIQHALALQPDLQGAQEFLEQLQGDTTPQAGDRIPRPGNN